MEKVLAEKQQMELLRDELANREELLRKKELLMQEKNQLEVKKLRASHNLHSHANLEEAHSQLVKQRKQLDDKLSKGDLLLPAEERRLIEIGEAIEALEVAIEFESESIREQENRIRDSIVYTANDSAQVKICLHLQLLKIFKFKFCMFEKLK